MKVALTYAACDACQHIWTAITEDPDRCFGLECSACGEMRGKLVGPRSMFPTVEAALAFTQPKPAKVIPLRPR